MSEATASKRSVARVNGELVGKAPRARVDKRRWNDDIAWYLGEAGGELGERGVSIDPSGGGGGNPADTWHLHEQRLRSGPAVAKWRRLRAVWVELRAASQRHLRVRYRDLERQHSEIMGLRAAFGDLAGLAWDLCQDQAELRKRLCAGSAKSDPVISKLRRDAEAANKAAHLDWLDQERLMAPVAEVPRRPVQ
jgi:hypothetical protein